MVYKRLHFEKELIYLQAFTLFVEA